MTLRFLFPLAAVAVLSACTQLPHTPGGYSSQAAPQKSELTPSQDTAALAAMMPAYRYVLLGEQHDNAEGHRLRYEALAQAVAQGWRPLIAMEQFDQEQAELLAQARSACGQDADCVIARAGPPKSGWDWAFYRPIVALALQYDLPLVPANLSRAQAGKVLRQGVDGVFDPAAQASLGLDGPIPERLLPLHNEIFAGLHGGHVSAEQVAPFSRAQMARDAVMAASLRRQDGGPAVLIAGNGHVRGDVGVARWLNPQDGPVLLVGYLSNPDEQGSYDVRVPIPAVGARP